MSDVNPRDKIWATMKDNHPGWDYIGGLPITLWLENILTRKPQVIHRNDWRSSNHMNLFDEHEGIIHVAGYNDKTFEYRTALVQDELVYAFQNTQDGHFHVYMAADTKDKISLIEEDLKQIFPVREKVKDQVVAVDFWNYGSNGPKMLSRDIAVPKWEEISVNYSLKARQQLEDLMKSYTPGRGGQLILWEGSPGTGKTFSLRALAYEWRKWCSLSYIVDPETFFGTRADYMMQVLLDEEPSYSFNDEEEKKDLPWRLLVLEDTGELLAADAKQRQGQGFSRLLNVVDGLIGQGLRILILVTTNEKLNKLDPAVTRPGRCASQIEFEPLRAEEITAWYEHHNIEPPEKPENVATVASLFARAEGLSAPSEERFGFVK